MGCIKSRLRPSNTSVELCYQKQNESLLEECEIQMNFLFREHQFLTLLPTEMWDLILQNIHEPEYLLNCCQASSTWNKLLEKRKQTMYFQLILPSLLTYLNKCDLLRCCQVSRVWSEAVDTCIDYVNDKEKIHWITLKIRDTQRGKFVSQFLKLINAQRPTPINLLMYRNVCLSYNKLTGRTDTPQQYRDQLLYEIKEFLEKYGNLVRHLRLQITWEEPLPEFSEIAKLVCTWLQFMPNLRNLEVEICTSLANEHQKEREYIFWEYLLSLPDMPYLKYFKIDSKIGQIIDLLLVRYGTSLEHMYVLKYGTNGTPAPCEASFSRLQNLEIRINSVGCIERFRAFSQAYQLKLKKLVVTFDCEMNSAIATELIQIVSLFHSELKELNLKCCDRPGFIYYVTPEFSNCQNLRLLELKKLTLSDIGFLSGDILARVAPNLECVVVE